MDIRRSWWNSDICKDRPRYQSYAAFSASLSGEVSTASEELVSISPGKEQNQTIITCFANYQVTLIYPEDLLPGPNLGRSADEELPASSTVVIGVNEIEPLS